MRTQCLPALTAGITAAIFIFDTITDYEIAFATFYIIVVLLSLYFCRGRGVVAVSAGCVLLTLVSYCLTSEGEFRPGIINLAISLLAIGATTFLALKIEAARTIATEAQVQLARVARV
ncbi:MAG: two-component sensor histidine kinase, partial [Methanobacterium sp.]|nr:two-component sensor histidine kinase [Methanobacterium sp.]